MRSITEIIIHCTATPEGREVSREEVRKWHLQRGFTDIGYHYLILLDGKTEKGRDEASIGAHCEGHNYCSIGVCYVGGCDQAMKPKDTRTAAQKNALVNLLKVLKAKYPAATIHGHREFAQKACPCFDATKEYANISG
jgi:N-acetylmuramoyl-L-alanine amidase